MSAPYDIWSIAIQRALCDALKTTGHTQRGGHCTPNGPTLPAAPSFKYRVLQGRRLRLPVPPPRFENDLVPIKALDFR